MNWHASTSVDLKYTFIYVLALMKCIYDISVSTSFRLESETEISEVDDSSVSHLPRLFLYAFHDRGQRVDMIGINFR